MALGNFDGVHLGHCAVIRALSVASSSFKSQPAVALEGSPVEEGCRTAIAPPGTKAFITVVSFTPHPQVFFSGQPKPLLTPLPEKVPLLESLGVEQLVLLPFNEALANLSPEAFVEEVLVQQLQANSISVGFNFCFGYQRSGTAQDLQTIAGRYGIPVHIVAPKQMAGDRISSSAVREALEQGDVQRAQQLLGRPYSLTGTVVQGQQLGRTLGFPTANLSLPAEKFLPRTGVYRVQATGDVFSTPQLGVMNIGHRPTIGGTLTSIEVHLLDWSGELYGHTVTVQLEQFLRPEQKFESLEALKTQIQQDCVAARR